MAVLLLLLWYRMMLDNLPPAPPPRRLRRPVRLEVHPGVTRSPGQARLAKQWKGRVNG